MKFPSSPSTISFLMSVSSVRSNAFSPIHTFPPTTAYLPKPLFVPILPGTFTSILAFSSSSAKEVPTVKPLSSATDLRACRSLLFERSYFLPPMVIVLPSSEYLRVSGLPLASPLISISLFGWPFSSNMLSIPLRYTSFRYLPFICSRPGKLSSVAISLISTPSGPCPALTYSTVRSLRTIG